MEAKINYTIAGIIVLILIAGLIAAGLWLSVGFGHKKTKIYEVDMHEAVSGLSHEAAVKFNGVPVGYVKEIEINRQNPQEVRLLLSIEDGTPITTSTVATLIAQGITGTTYIGLMATSADTTPLQKAPDQPYPVIPAQPSMLRQLDYVLKSVSENINKLSLKIGSVFNKENTTNIQKTITNFKTITTVIAKDRQQIDQLIRNSDVFLRNAAKFSNKFPEISHDIQISAQKFQGMAVSLKTAGKEISSTMQEGKLTMNKISEQLVPQIINLLHKVDIIAINLEKVSAQMQTNPAVLVRGIQTPKPGPGE